MRKYHVGWEAFVLSNRHSKELNSLAAKHWVELTKPAAVAKLPNLSSKYLVEKEIAAYLGGFERCT